MIAAINALGWFTAFVLLLLVVYILNELRNARATTHHYRALYEENHQQRNQLHEELLTAKGALLALEDDLQGKASRVVDRLFGDEAR